MEKNNSAAMDDEVMAFANHDSELNENVVTILDIISDTEDTVDNGESYLQEISNIIAMAKDNRSVVQEPEERTTKASYGGSDKECLWREEFVEVSSAALKQEQLAPSEEKAQQCVEKHEDYPIDDELDNVLIQKTTCDAKVTDCQSMDAPKQKTPCVQMHHTIDPEFEREVLDIKAEIVLDEDQAGANQNDTEDTVRVENTNEVFYIYEFSPPQAGQQQLTSWKSYKYFCNSCDYTTKDVKMLITHSNYAHVNLSFKCADCLKTTHNYHDFISHVQTQHHPALKLRCDACDLLCDNDIQYGLHRHIDCLPAKRLPNYAECPYCSRIFSKNKWKHSHIRMHLLARPEDKLKCKYCDQESPSRCALNQHYTAHMKREANTDKMPCDKCKDTFVEDEIQNVKVYTVLDTTFFVCHICKQLYEYTMDLRSHLKGHATRHCKMC